MASKDCPVCKMCLANISVILYHVERAHVYIICRLPWEETLISAAYWVYNLQLILIQDFIEKEWKDNGRDKCTGPGAPADIGRGKLYLRWTMGKTKERNPTRCIISDYMTTTLESSDNTYPDELDTSRWGFSINQSK